MMHLYLVMGTHLPVLEPTLMLLIVICSGICTSATDTGNHDNPASRHRHQNHRSAVSHAHRGDQHTLDLYTQSFDTGNAEPLVQAEETLQIHWLNSSLHEISISWTFAQNYNISGFIKNSVVEYFTDNGRFTSHPLSSDVMIYTVVDLIPDTIYTMCVYVNEVYSVNNASSLQHTKCVKLKTIDYIRQDSLVAMLITFGYFCFMALVGYRQWKIRVWEIERISKKRAKSRVDNPEEEATTSTMRWQDLAERDLLLNSKPGISIECNDT